jgi:hypothetical protein
MDVRVSTKRIAGVIGNVEPLVTVSSPGVGQLDPSHQMGGLSTGSRPQPEGAVDVVPSSNLAGCRRHGGEIIERPGVYVPRL